MNFREWAAASVLAAGVAVLAPIEPAAAAYGPVTFEFKKVSNLSPRDGGMEASGWVTLQGWAYENGVNFEVNETTNPSGKLHWGSLGIVGFQFRLEKPIDNFANDFFDIKADPSNLLGFLTPGYLIDTFWSFKLNQTPLGIPTLEIRRNTHNSSLLYVWSGVETYAIYGTESILDSVDCVRLSDGLYNEHQCRINGYIDRAPFPYLGISEPKPFWILGIALALLAAITSSQAVQRRRSSLSLATLKPKTLEG